MEQTLVAKHISETLSKVIKDLMKDTASRFHISPPESSPVELLPAVEKPFPFLALPLDIRVIIYSYVLSWPTLSRNFSRMFPSASVSYNHYKHLSKEEREKTRVKPRMITPAIFLVNRQMKDEALGELARLPIVIDSPPICAAITNRPFDITEFISAPLLKNCRRVLLTINTDLTPADDLLLYRSDLQHWRPWEQCLSTLFLDVWAPGTHDLRILDVELGGAWSAQHFQDRKTSKLELDKKLRSPRLRKRCYRDSVLEQLRYGVRSLGSSVTVNVRGPDGHDTKYLLNKPPRK